MAVVCCISDIPLHFGSLFCFFLHSVLIHGEEEYIASLLGARVLVLRLSASLGAIYVCVST